MGNKQQLIKELANFLSGNEAMKSVALEVESKRVKGGIQDLIPKWGKEWCQLRDAAGINRWSSVEETEQKLKRLLS